MFFKSPFIQDRLLLLNLLLIRLIWQYLLDLPGSLSWTRLFFPEEVGCVLLEDTALRLGVRVVHSEEFCLVLLIKTTLLVDFLHLFILLLKHNTSVGLLFYSVEVVFVVVVDAALGPHFVLLAKEVVRVPLVQLRLLVHLHTVLYRVEPTTQCLVGSLGGGSGDAEEVVHVPF